MVGPIPFRCYIIIIITNIILQYYRIMPWRKCYTCDYHLDYKNDTERYRVDGECNYCAGEGICRECKTKCYDCNDIECCDNCCRGYFDPNIGVICEECVGDLISCEGPCKKKLCKDCIGHCLERCKNCDDDCCKDCVGNNGYSLQCCGYKFCKNCLQKHLDLESFDGKGRCEYNPDYLKEEDEYEKRLESLHFKEGDDEYKEESVQEKV